MNRRFLFLAGEWTVSMPLAFADEQWSHTSVARKLIRNNDGTYARFNIVERLEGFLYFASVENAGIRRHNLVTLARQNVPCWPSPGKLLRIDDRFALLQECVDAGFIDHPVGFLRWSDRHKMTLDHPQVVKAGNLHQGQGKFLVRTQEDVEKLESWEGIASVEPFFEGDSFRVLFVGADTFVLHFTNDSSWIKNSAGADVRVLEGFERCQDIAAWDMVHHARQVRDHFDLEVCGIDYVIDRRGNPHFLEYNCFPGVGTSDEIAASAKRLFRQKMDIVESEADQRREQTAV